MLNLTPETEITPKLDWSELSHEIEIQTGTLMRALYATDASEYQEMPLAVAFPKSPDAVGELVRFAAKRKLGLIPRTAGTSLAGQVVGNGLVVDTGRYLNKILKIDSNSRRVVVQPGVIRNDLNKVLAPHGLLFGPETSTANRAMIGGMVGNNSCGSNSLVYGSTRQHLVSCRGFLSDGSPVEFGPLSKKGFEDKCNGPDSLETRIYQKIAGMLRDSKNRTIIEEGSPKRSVTRRNTGYALDILMTAEVFDPTSSEPFNLCQLIAGSEGTLFIGTEYELNLEPIPPTPTLLCAHFKSVDEALRANLIALEFDPTASELIDKHILDCTKENIEQRKNRFFVEGDPGAILVVEIRMEVQTEAHQICEKISQKVSAAKLGYAFPILQNEDVDKVWELRRAGQGVMTNVVGDTRPAEIVEDTAVDVQDLPQYIREFDAIMRNKYDSDCVYYAHAGSGELHTRPLLNLKTEEGHAKFRAIATDVAELVRKYKGSLSGEHGDGRLRGEFIQYMVGKDCYQLMRDIKTVFDPDTILNPGKIIDTPPMDEFHRYAPGHPTPEYETVLDFRNTMGILRAAEKCNGSGDCRKTQLTGGTMCPSYMATRNEKDTTRARANMLRHVLTNPPKPDAPFVNNDLKEVMDLCISCKGCKNECPSNVDVTKMKAEFLYQYQKSKGVPLRSRIIAGYAVVATAACRVSWLWNRFFSTPFLRKLSNRIIGFHPDRTIPPLHKQTLRQWFRKHQKANGPKIPASKGSVYLFCDEFTNTQDVPIGIAAVELLEGLGYEVILLEHPESGRAALSKGLLDKARALAAHNVNIFYPHVTRETPLIGLEPSAILGFRDEYPDLLRDSLQEKAKQMGEHCLLLDEFLAAEWDAGKIESGKHFQPLGKTIHLHGHCHQKALSSLTPTVKILKHLAGCEVRVIPSGCCGMAGSFGYEKEHYELSQQIGELVFFPKVRKASEDDIIAAPGTSCRHQIHDATERVAFHPATLLRKALKNW